MVLIMSREIFVGNVLECFRRSSGEPRSISGIVDDISGFSGQATKLRPQVRAAIKSLEKKGLIVVVSDIPRAKTYRIA